MRNIDRLLHLSDCRRAGLVLQSNSQLGRGFSPTARGKRSIRHLFALPALPIVLAAAWANAAEPGGVYRHAKVKPMPHEAVELTGGFWGEVRTRSRDIGGQRILFTLANVGQGVAAYRFEKDSEIAVPAMLLHLGESKTRAKPRHAPPAERWLWRDANGDGQMDAGEFRAIEDGENMRDLFVDENGGLWLTTKADDAGFFHLPCAGLDAHGIPRHDWPSKRRFTPPAGLAEAGRLFYECATDTLHIGGFTKAQPRKGSEFKQFGNEVRSYAGWLHGDRREVGRVTLPYVPKGKGGHEAFSAQNLWVAGDFIFIGISASAEVLAYQRATGKLQRVFVPGPKVGGRSGLLDLTHALNAIQLRAVTSASWRDDRLAGLGDQASSLSIRMTCVSSSAVSTLS